jgi:hypothetical protein
VVGGDTFQRVLVRRDPQSVAFTSPANATGLFDLDPQAEMLLPFEGLGVEAAWELQLPWAANRIESSTLVEVLAIFEYMAFDSPTYRQQVIQALPAALTANRAFSFRHELADPWYDLHNPDQTATPMTVRWETGRDDFPPNLDDLRIRHVALYFARADGATFEVTVSGLRFREGGTGAAVGGAATSVDGMVNTRSGNGAAWTPILGRSPVGTWELALPDLPQLRARFADDQIQEMIFVITYAGRTPPWPA